MDTKRISMVSGAALLALTATASAGPMSVPTSDVIAPPQTQIEPVHYRYWHHHRYYRPYGWYHHRYYHRYYGWNPGAAVAGTALGLATIPFALAGGYYGYYPYHGYYGYYPYGGYYGGPYYYY